MPRKKSTSSRHEQWVAGYRDRQPLYERFCLKLKPLLEDLLNSEGIGYQIVEARAKSVSSFDEKIQREGKTYKDPIKEITDLAGLRVILYYVDDLAKVSGLIDQEFQVDEPRSVDKRAILAPDQFGYLSIHKIITISNTRANLPEWAGFHGLVAELQIRTVLQHSWAAISHALQYKREADIPNQFRRRLIRISGLLELADEEFSSLRQQQASLRSDIAEKVSEGDLNIGIDVLSVWEFINKSKVVAELEGIALGLGYGSTGDAVGGMSQITQPSQIFGINTIKALEEVLNRAKPRAKAFLREFLRLENQEAGDDIAIIISKAHLTAMIIVGSQTTPRYEEEVRRSLTWGKGYITHAIVAGKLLRKRKPS